MRLAEISFPLAAIDYDMVDFFSGSQI